MDEVMHSVRDQTHKKKTSTITRLGTLSYLWWPPLVVDTLEGYAHDVVSLLDLLFFFAARTSR